MLVIRTSDGKIRWMDVSACLKRESAGGKTVKQIVFETVKASVRSRPFPTLIKLSLTSFFESLANGSNE